MTLKVTKWNYIVPLRMFLHYLGKSGTPVSLHVVKYDHIPKYSAIYLALGHFKYESGHDVYDFNEGEWPRWLINMGKPYDVYWEPSLQ